MDIHTKIVNEISIIYVENLIFNDCNSLIYDSDHVK